MIAFFLISASHKATKGHFELLFHISLSSLVSLLLHGNDFIFIGNSYPHRTHRFFRSPTSRTCNTGSSHCTICFQRFHRTFHHFCNSFAAYCSMFFQSFGRYMQQRHLYFIGIRHYTTIKVFRTAGNGSNQSGNPSTRTTFCGGKGQFLCFQQLSYLSSNFIPYYILS